MIGVDNSEDILQIAGEKTPRVRQKHLYLASGCAGIGALRNREGCLSILRFHQLYSGGRHDLREVFSLVNNYLDPKGMFIFDLNTKYKYEQMGETTIAENREKAKASSGIITVTRRKRSTNMSLPFSSRREKIPICTVNLRRYIIRERTILRRSAAYWKRQAWSL